MARKNHSTNGGFNLINITQWAIPTAILFAYVLVTLYSFSSDMKADAKYTVRQKISDYNDTLIISFNTKMDVSRAVADAMADVVAEEIKAGKDVKQIMIDTIKPTIKTAIANDAKIFDTTGKGIASDGLDTSVIDKSDLESCLGEKTLVMSEPYLQGEDWYVDIYTPVIGDSAKAEYALVYSFITNVFSDIPTTSKFDGRTCYALIGSDGTVISIAGRKILNRGDNLFDSESVKISSATENRTKSNLSNRNAGYTDCTVAGEERVMVYDPAAYSGLAVGSFVTQSYVENEVHSTYGDMESILIRVVVAMIAFFVAILAINLANKAVNTRHNQSLQEKAETDLLTGLLNKISTEQKVSDYLTEAKSKDQSALLFLIDIDNFKKVNDTMGHAFGDELLAGLGLGLSTLFRATDIVGRIGGDEFLVLMRNISPDEETKKREAEKLLTFFRDFKVGEYVQYRCTASIGGAVFSQDGGDFEELYKAADSAMYESKRHGKNRVAYYGEELEGPVIELGKH